MVIGNITAQEIDIDTRPLLPREIDQDLLDDETSIDSSLASSRNNNIISNMKKSNCPDDTALKQQRMVAWQPILDPVWVAAAYLLIGVIFVPLGLTFNAQSSDVVEMKIQYDGAPEDGVPYQNCSIAQPFANRSCQLIFTVEEDMEAPVLVHYEMGEFYQNHRKYIQSRDDYQLMGEDQDKFGEMFCAPLDKLTMNGVEQRLSPCGFVANTFFNDVFKLNSATYQMQEKGIAWKSDVDDRFKQPKDFRSEACSSCDDVACSCDGEEWSCTEPWRDDDGTCFLYFYPDDNTTWYLHETYSPVINPIEGVTNEHFIVWMRTAALPTFRKLYGYIEEDIPAGTILTFNLTANYEVKSFLGQKKLILSTTNWLGGKNDYVGFFFLLVGSICLALGVLFGSKHYFDPRRLGDPKYLKVKEE